MSGRWWRAGKLVGTACAVAVGVLGAAPAAWASSPPSLYWTNDGSGAIGSSNLGGTNPNATFITGGSAPVGVIVDASHIYWANIGDGTIGRANLDGTSSTQSFITGANEPSAVAVSGSHIYWANFGAGTIGEANLDGSDVNQSFITGANLPNGVAVDGSHIYWSNQLADTIGRANLDGSAVNQNFIATGASGLGRITVDGSHIYWSNQSGGTIGEANLDGTAVNQSFITGANDPNGVAVDGSHIYWSNFGSGTIGAANLDGSDVNQSIVTASSVVGVAVSVPVAQPSATSLSFPTTAQATLSAPQTLSITNTGQNDLTIGGLSFSGADASDFLIGSNTCLAAVAPGESCQVTVSFAPQAQGARSASLQIVTNDVPNSPLTVTLSGTGGSLPAGATGPAGPAGPTGATGPRGPAGKVELVTCKTVTKKVRGHRRKLQKCTARLVSKTVKFTAAAASAKLSRASHVVASGVSVAAGGGVTELLLADEKPLRRGGYTLSVRSLRGGRWMVHRTTITIA
jgi:virginiamycin B lyase